MLKYSTYRSIYDKEPKTGVSAPSGALSSIQTLNLTSAASTASAIVRGLLLRGGFIKLALILMLIVSGFTVVSNVFAGSVTPVKQGKQIVVEYGDTLWGIAQDNKPADMRTVVYIEGIKRSSGLQSGNIKAGDVLTLPVYE